MTDTLLWLALERLGASTMRILWALPIAVSALAYVPRALADGAPPTTGLIERVVAVVGHRAIFLSTLRARSKPFLVQIEQSIPEGAQRTAAKQAMQKDLLNRLVEEELIAVDAEQKKLAVAPEEVSLALKTIADGQKLSVAELLKAAEAQSLNEVEYRAEIRRQLIEGKLLQLRVREEHIVMPHSDAEVNELLQKERETMVQGFKGKTYIDLRL